MQRTGGLQGPIGIAGIQRHSLTMLLDDGQSDASEGPDVEIGRDENDLVEMDRWHLVVQFFDGTLYHLRPHAVNYQVDLPSVALACDTSQESSEVVRAVESVFTIGLVTDHIALAGPVVKH